MQVHIFRATGRIFGCTADETGGNLPAQIGPWQVFKTIELENGGLEVPGIDGNVPSREFSIFRVTVDGVMLQIPERLWRIPCGMALGERQEGSPVG